MGIRHSGNDHKWVQNLGYLVTINGIKVLHVGDAELSERALGKFRFAEENIDVAILPYWFINNYDQVEKLINPDQIILTHVSPDRAYIDIEEIQTLYNDVEVFTTSGQIFSY